MRNPTTRIWIDHGGRGLAFRTYGIAAAALVGAIAFGSAALAATTVQIGPSGKTFASLGVQCAIHPRTGVSSPAVRAGVFNPRPRTQAELHLNGKKLRELDAESPAARVWLADGSNAVTVMLNKRLIDTYDFVVTGAQCGLPPGNFYSPDGTLEYAASGKSYLTVTPGCALNPSTGVEQPFVNLFDNGSFLLNVSVNGAPLTQLSAVRPRATVFLNAGMNTITAENGALSTDRFMRDGGSGTCLMR